MTQEQYNELRTQIDKEHQAKINNLNKEYVERNKRFNVGDFVFNVTGIIKVERVGFKEFRGNLDIVYYGYRYKKYKGTLSRTKDKKIDSLYESNTLKLMKQ